MELAAVPGPLSVIAKPLRRMVADLLEAGQKRQHHATAFDAVQASKLLGEQIHRFLIEGRLYLGQCAVGDHFGLLRQIRNDVAIGLEPTQDVGANQFA